MERHADRFLQATLLAALIVHVIALFAMLFLVLPGIPGTGATDWSRVRYVGTHALAWHIGWFPWHLCALSDLLLSMALLRSKWIGKLASLPTLVLTLIAVTIEQPSEFLWDFTGPNLAAFADASGNISSYIQFEQTVFFPVCVLAAVVYALMAMGWSWCLSHSTTWSRTLTWLSAFTWTLLLLLGPAPILPQQYKPPIMALTLANALGFNLMNLWYILALESVLRRSRKDTTTGPLSPWTYPKRGFAGRCLNLIANSRCLRYVGAFFPSLRFESDITNVVYINYLVESTKLEALLPPGLELQRLGIDGKYSLFIHFLKFLMPSPLQSNWRIHVTEPLSGLSGVYFLYTINTNILVAMLGRTFSRSLSMHVPLNGELTVSDGKVNMRIDPGHGSSPDLIAALHPPEARQEWSKHPQWIEVFDNLDNFLAYCLPQDRALCAEPWDHRISSEEIELDIPLSECRTLTGEVRSQTVEHLIGDVEPVCFLVPSVRFRFNGRKDLPSA